MEKFLIRVAYSCEPEHNIRREEVTADVGLECPTPPPTWEEMNVVAAAAKMALLKCLRKRKAKAELDKRLNEARSSKTRSIP